MATLECVVTSPEEMVFEGGARSVVVPALDGEMGILPGHAALVGALSFGELRIEREDGSKQRYFVRGGGFVEVAKNRVTVLAADVEDLAEADVAAAEANLEAARADRPESRDAETLAAHYERIRVAKTRLRLVRR